MYRYECCNWSLKMYRYSGSSNPASLLLIGSLSNNDGDGHENGKKSSRFRLTKQQLCTCITLFCTFPCRRCSTTTWNCLISRFVEDVNTTQRPSFSFHELWYSPLESNSSQIRQHLTNWTRWNKRDRAWRSANTLFNWRFRSCRRRWTLLKLSINEVRREGKRAYARGELLWYFDLGVGRWFGRRVLIRAWAL